MPAFFLHCPQITAFCFDHGKKLICQQKSQVFLTTVLSSGLQHEWESVQPHVGVGCALDAAGRLVRVPRNTPLFSHENQAISSNWLKSIHFSLSNLTQSWQQIKMVQITQHIKTADLFSSACALFVNFFWWGWGIGSKMNERKRTNSSSPWETWLAFFVYIIFGVFFFYLFFYLSPGEGGIRYWDGGGDESAGIR